VQSQELLEDGSIGLVSYEVAESEVLLRLISFEDALVYLSPCMNDIQSAQNLLHVHMILIELSSQLVEQCDVVPKDGASVLY
jgi:hypothetical protein